MRERDQRLCRKQGAGGRQREGTGKSPQLVGTLRRLGAVSSRCAQQDGTRGKLQESRPEQGPLALLFVKVSARISRRCGGDAEPRSFARRHFLDDHARDGVAGSFARCGLAPADASIAESETSNVTRIYESSPFHERVPGLSLHLDTDGCIRMRPNFTILLFL